MLLKIDWIVRDLSPFLNIKRQIKCSLSRSTHPQSIIMVQKRDFFSFCRYESLHGSENVFFLKYRVQTDPKNRRFGRSLRDIWYSAFCRYQPLKTWNRRANIPFFYNERTEKRQFKKVYCFFLSLFISYRCKQINIIVSALFSRQSNTAPYIISTVTIVFI